MPRFRVYLKTFDAFGNYDADYSEISSDVLKVGTITQSLDNSEYDVGIFRNGTCVVQVRNDHGHFSEPGQLRTLFLYRRSGSLMKITWDRKDYDLCCGFFKAGDQTLAREVVIFEGILDEVPAASQIDDQILDLTVMGFESLLDRALVPFDSITNGDLASDLIYTCLNQSIITRYLTVNADNITVSHDVAIDTKDSLENETVKEGLKNLLLVTNSVLFIRDGAIYVTGRGANPDTVFTFCGQASDLGIENVIDVSAYRDGLNRTINFWTWQDTSLFSQQVSSIDQYGILTKDVACDLIDDASTVKIQALLDTCRDEFGAPKTEMDIQVPINRNSAALFLQDRVRIDYPTVFSSADGQPLPRYGQNIYNGARYPYGQWSLVIDPADRFKVLSRKVDPVTQTFTFGLRKI